MNSIYRTLSYQTGLSLTQIAKNLKISQGTLSHYANKIRHPRIYLAWRIIDFAKFHGISINLEDIYPKQDFVNKK